MRLNISGREVDAVNTAAAAAAAVSDQPVYLRTKIFSFSLDFFLQRPFPNGYWNGIVTSGYELQNKEENESFSGFESGCICHKMGKFTCTAKLKVGLEQAIFRSGTRP